MASYQISRALSNFNQGGFSKRDNKFLKFYFGDCNFNGTQAMMKADPSLTQSSAASEASRLIARIGKQNIVNAALEKNRASMGDAIAIVAEAMHKAYRKTLTGEDFPDFRTRVEAAKVVLAMHGLAQRNGQEVSSESDALSWESALAQQERTEQDVQEAQIVEESTGE